MAELTETARMWLKLMMCDGIGPRRAAVLRERYRTVENIFSAPEEELRKLRLPEASVRAVVKNEDSEALKRRVEQCGRKGIGIVSIADADYPACLRAIYDAPPVLYCRGRGELLKTPMMAVVGARKCTAYGSRAAHAVGRFLAASGYTVVSGMAVGVDAWSHRGALDGGGATVAVLGCGTDICYPPDQRSLWLRIQSEGLLLSEYPPGTEPRAGFFPMRNRIISGLSKGVVVVEAGEKSGSLITADQALEQGREVYAVPGSIFAPMSRGTNHLIAQGAAAPLCAVEDLPLPDGRLRTAEAEKKQNPPRGRNSREEQLIGALGSEGKTAAELQKILRIPYPEVQQVLTVLEIQGMICHTPDQRWIVSGERA